MSRCMCDCKSCLVHEYGVYILDSCWVAIMSLVTYAYREELKALYYGRLKLRDPLNNAHSNSGPNNPNQQGQSNSLRLVEAGADVSQLMAPPPPSQPLANQTAANPFNTVISTANDYDRSRGRVLATNMAAQYKNPTGNMMVEDGRLPAAFVPFKAMLPNYVESAQPASYKNITQKDQVDQFKLPTAKKAPVVKSTGSGYFQQMMQGKKPVASISQYQQIKDDLNKNKNKNSTKKQQDKDKKKHKKHHKK